MTITSASLVSAPLMIAADRLNGPSSPSAARVTSPVRVVGSQVGDDPVEVPASALVTSVAPRDDNLNLRVSIDPT